MATVNGQLKDAIGITGGRFKRRAPLLLVGIRAMMRLRIRVEEVMNAMGRGVN